MRNIFRKIPLIFWAVALSLIAFIVVRENYIEGFTSEQTRLLSGFLTFIGLIFVAINIQRQWKNERIKTEYLNQPDFFLKGFARDKFEGSGPVLCSNPTECTEDHWFDLVQIGNLAARNLKVAFFTGEEANANVLLKERWLEEERLGKDDNFQYKLPQFKIPFSHFDKNNSMCFILLLDYRSEYSNIRYKRVYKLCSTANPHPKEVNENDWKGRIGFYNSSLIMTNDTDSISFKEIFLNKWYQFSRWAKIKKDYSYEEWIVNI